MIRAAVLGSPINHSLSPLLHNRIYRELGIAGSYEAIEVKSGELANFFNSLDLPEWSGFSLTMPLKEEIIHIANNVAEVARKIASANLALISNSGDISVESTDVIGFQSLITPLGLNKRSSVTVLGAGGTARTAIWALDPLVGKITVAARSANRSELLRNCVTEAELEIVTWGNFAQHLQVDLVINTTPYETTAEIETQIGKLGRIYGTLIDSIYSPWPRPTLQSWVANGGDVIDGFALLIAQALPQASKMVNRNFDFAEMTRVLKSAVKEHIHN